jgi:hypothetical protein
LFYEKYPLKVSTADRSAAQGKKIKDALSGFAVPAKGRKSVF